MRRFFPLLIIVLLAAGSYKAYQQFVSPSASTASPASGKQDGGVPIEAVKVEVAPLTSQLSTVGTLLANESLMLKPEIDGRIENIHLQEGATAQKGALLVSIDDDIYEAEVKEAEAAIALARADYNRAKILKEKMAGTVSQFDTASANLKVAEAKLNLAKARLAKTHITAPFDGVMGLRHISPGDYVTSGQNIATFQSIHPMKVEFTLPETAMQSVAPNQEINVEMDAIPGRNFNGHIYAIDPQIDEQSRNMKVRALIPNEDRSLQPGLFARIFIITGKKENALFVPESAIVPRGTQSFVMKIDADNKVSSIQVTLGERQNGRVEVTNGLTSEDIVVTAGHLKLQEGSEVSYQLESAQGEK